MRLADEGRNIASSVFTWLLCSKRTLSTQELIAAVTPEPKGSFQMLSEMNILDLCNNLVIVDDETGIFRFAHLSVREYLENRPEYSTEHMHVLAARRCLRALSTPSNSSDMNEAMVDVEGHIRPGPPGVGTNQR